MRKECACGCKKFLPPSREKENRKYIALHSPNKKERKGSYVPCSQCKKIIYVVPNRVKRFNNHFCSHECEGIRKRKWIGKKATAWKGGRFKTIDGYIAIRDSSLKHGYILEHRLVMQKKLKRLLKSKEIVHHINKNRSDNRPKNLKIVTKGKHNKIHFTKRVI